MNYIFKYKRKYFWKKIQVVGHNYLQEQDKMVIYREDGGLKEIKEWSKCEVELGTDWVLAVKKKMEEKTGTTVPLNVKG